MTIATWNIERPAKTSNRFPAIIACIKKIDPDILILTETNEFIKLGDDYYVFHTTIPSLPPGISYKEGERRVSIYSKFESAGQLTTFRDETCICIILKTPFGELAVYGTVIGITGNKGEEFKNDLNEQLLDFDRIAKDHNLCIAGDLNTSFNDNYYFAKDGRKMLDESFQKNNLINLTKSIPRNIDHIILPKTFVDGRTNKLHPWNLCQDKSLSDHMGVSVALAAV